MKAISSWLLNSNAVLNRKDRQPLQVMESAGYTFEIIDASDSLWIVASWPNGSRIAFRLAYSPNDTLDVKKITENKGVISMDVRSLIGKYEIAIKLPQEQNSPLRLTTTLTPSAPLLFPYWPRDIVPLGAKSSDILAEGEVIAKQVGTRSGQLFFKMTRPAAGSVFYLQNLTALADYNHDTETSAGETVGGELKDAADQSEIMQVMNGKAAKESIIHQALTANPQFGIILYNNLVASNGG